MRKVLSNRLVIKHLLICVLRKGKMYSTMGHKVTLLLIVLVGIFKSRVSFHNHG